MKVLVNNISLENLNAIKDYFVGEGEIKFLEFADKNPKTHEYASYYIEENIKDLDGLIKLTDEMEVDFATRRRVLKIRRFFVMTKKDWQIQKNFMGFQELILLIKKQREAGREISDIEYIYLSLKDKYDIKLVDSLTLDGFTIETQVICGTSSLGKFELYSDNPDMNWEFVFCYETEKTVKGNKKILNGHWHPKDDYREAIRDVEDFMNGNIKL